MKLLYIAHKFPPEPMGADRSLRQLIALQNLGHEIRVLTALPSYPRGRIFRSYRRRLLVRETREGLAVARVRTLTSPNRGFILRTISFISFWAAASLAGLFMRRADVVMAAVPSPGTELAGLLIAKFRQCSFVLEMIDVMPDNLEFLGMSRGRPAIRLLHRYYRAVYRRSAAIAVLSASARSVLAERGADKRKIVLLPNAADPEVLDRGSAEEVRRTHGLGSDFLVVFAGSFSPYYQVPNMVDAAEIAIAARPDIHFLLLGSGPEYGMIRKRISGRGTRNIIMTGVLPRSRIGGYLKAADVFLYSLVASSTPRAYTSHLSAKACDYLYAGRPIIAVENGPILGPLLDMIGAGVSVPSGEPASLARAIIAFHDEPDLRVRCGQAGRSYACKHLTREKVVSEFERQLRTILPDARRTRGGRGSGSARDTQA
jgi:colanic acid biosynthesis glycosyl transferase WcaI